MSLINEALKKVQKEQQGTRQTSAASPASGSPKPPGKEQKRNRSFIWGFIAAILIVGTVSTLLATFFVWQIIEKPERESTPPPAEDQGGSPVVSESPPPAAVNPIEATSVNPPVERFPSEPAPEETALPDKPSLSLADVSDPGPDASETPVGQQPPPASPEASGTGKSEKTDQAEPSPPPHDVGSEGRPLPPNPDVIARLQELEIRGIMSGGSKVLIFDSATGKTRAYRAGESLSGSMGLEVVEITPSTIQFKDYEGRLHTKSF